MIAEPVRRTGEQITLPPRLRNGVGLGLFLGCAHAFSALGAVGKRGPRSFGPAATLAHMLERRRFPFFPRLSDAGEEELQLG